MFRLKLFLVITEIFKRAFIVFTRICNYIYNPTSSVIKRIYHKLHLLLSYQKGRLGPLGPYPGSATVVDLFVGLSWLDS